MKQFIPVSVCTIVAASTSWAQGGSPPSSPVPSQKPKIVRIAPKPVRVAPNPAPKPQPPTTNVAATNVQAPAANPPARKQINVISFSDALARTQRARHSRDWWKRHFTTIVFVGGGYYYFDAGYWFPAWGYDPSYESYDYDGPIFTYGNLLPDQVIVNVQRALQQLGYFGGPVSGSLSPATRRAISAFQQDNGLEINGVVDGPTVQALGLI